MSTSSKIDWSKATAAEIAASAPLGDAARRLMKNGASPTEYVDHLLAEKLHVDAARFLAFGLPLRRAVWWGCLCLRRSAGTLPADQEAALKAAAKWAQQPVEERRQAVEKAQGPDPLATPAGCLAWAVTVTGSHVAFPGLPPSPPEPEVAPKAINGAVLSAAAIPSVRPPARDYYREFVALGIQVLQGRYLWDSV
jgi:hypothetical protein